MKRKYALILFVLIFSLMLAACGCEHEWNSATCDAPITCSLCGETDGAPLGHSWYAATCETAKTCEVCGVTEGEALGHSWEEATCTAPRTCTACAVTEGEALGHAWEEATTEAPKTCSVCAETEGERIITDERFTTAASSALFGKWSFELVLPGDALQAGLGSYVDTISCIMSMDFSNDGNVILNVGISDIAAMEDLMIRYTTDLMYAQFTTGGMNQSDADAAMIQTYGMNVVDYVTAEVQKMDLNALFDSMNMTGVYYVDGDQLYVGDSWDQDLEPARFSVDGDTLTIYEDLAETGAASTVLTRVTE